MPGGLVLPALIASGAAEVPPTKGEEKHSGRHGPEEYPGGTHARIVAHDLAW